MNRPPRPSLRHSALFALVFVALVANVAHADTVKFKNGDTLTGKVVAVLDGKVIFTSDALGELSIDLAQVETLATDDSIDVQLVDGSTVHGKAVATSGGSFDVEPATGGKVVVPFASLAAVNKPPREWKGSLAASATWVRGNTNTDAIALDATAENRGDIDRIRAEAWYRVMRQEDPNTGDESTSERRMGIFGQYDRFFEGDKFYGYGNVRFERDFLASIDLRAIAGVGVGYQFIENDKTTLAGEAGVAWFYENYSNDTDTMSDPAIRAAMNFTHNFSDKSSCFDSLEAYKVLGDPDDYLVRNKGGFRQTLFENFFAQEWIEWVWDSSPADGAEQVDTTYYIGVGWTF